MGLTELRESLEKSASSEAQAILEEGKLEAGKILNSAKLRIAKEAEEQMALQKVKAEGLKSKLATQAKFEAKKMLLEQKKALLGSIVESARQELGKLSAEKKRQILKKLIAKAGAQIEISNVYVNPGDIKFVEGFTARSAPIIGGLIAENGDGTVRMDFSFDSLLEQEYERIMPELAEILFG